MILDNPEFVRHRRVWLRHPFTAAIIVLVIAMIITSISFLQEFNSYDYGRSGVFDYADVGEGIFISFYIIANIIFLFFNNAQCLRSISAEIEHKTYDFQLTNLLTPFELLLGKLFGSTVLGHFVVLLLIPFMLAGAILAKLPIFNFLGLIAIMYLFAIFTNMLFLLLSFYLFKNSYVVFGIGGVFFLYFVLSSGMMFGENFSFITPLQTMSSLFEQETYDVSFYGYIFNGLIFNIFCYIYMIYWLGIALVAKLKKTRLKFTATSLYLFLLSFQILVLGVYWFKHPMIYQGYRYISEDLLKIAANYFSYFFVFFMLVFLMIGKSRDKVYLWVRQFGGKSLLRTVFSENAPAFNMIMISAITGTLLFLLVSMGRSIQEIHLLVMACFILFVARETLYFSTMALYNIRFGFTLLYLVLYYLLGSIIAAILESKLVYVMFPLTLFFKAGSNDLSFKIVIPILIMEISLFGIFYILAMKKIRRQAESRDQK